jgi:hypothetical protein
MIQCVGALGATDMHDVLILGLIGLLFAAAAVLARLCEWVGSR